MINVTYEPGAWPALLEMIHGNTRMILPSGANGILGRVFEHPDYPELGPIAASFPGLCWLVRDHGFWRRATSGEAMQLGGTPYLYLAGSIEIQIDRASAHSAALADC
jgi:hypothetical protein